MAWIEQSSPLLTLGLVLVSGVTLGALAKRCRLPSVTGQILAGVLVGPSVLDLLPETTSADLKAVTHFALGLMAVTVGSHLHLKSLRNAGRRLLLLLLCEVTLTPLLVYAALSLVPGFATPAVLLCAAIAVSTAPATIVALVREARAKGVFVKTLVAAVALNNMACILLFELAAASLDLEIVGGSSTFREALAAPATQFLRALLVGGGAAFLMELVTRVMVRSDLHATAGMVTILLTSGVAEALDTSPLLACLFLGTVQSNLTHVRERVVDSLFANFQPSIMAVFFTLAGLQLHFDQAKVAGLAAVAYFVARTAGKLLSVRAAMHWAGAPEKLRRYLGIALVPQAGLAIGLVFLALDRGLLTNPDTVQAFLATVLTVVTASELVGPLLTRFSLQRSGEAGRDRQRLIDFLQEENILVDFRAPDVETAIRRLTDHLVRSHRLVGVDRERLLESVIEREQEVSTCFGNGLAVPHGILPEGHAMVGVMGISREGVPAETPDHRPVHWMILLATSPDQRDRHVQVLASLARTVGQDEEMQRSLLAARSPAHAYELLHGEESESFNWYLDD